MTPSAASDLIPALIFYSYTASDLTALRELRFTSDAIFGIKFNITGDARYSSHGTKCIHCLDSAKLGYIRNFGPSSCKLQVL